MKDFARPYIDEAHPIKCSLHEGTQIVGLIVTEEVTFRWDKPKRYFICINCIAQLWNMKAEGEANEDSD